MTDYSVDPEKDTKTKPKNKEPKFYKVILLNDDFTYMDFVADILTTIFGKSIEEANHITLEIHQTGKAIAGVYTYDVAETKAVETIDLARVNGFPLLAQLEEE